MRRTINSLCLMVTLAGGALIISASPAAAQDSTDCGEGDCITCPTGQNYSCGIRGVCGCCGAHSALCVQDGGCTCS
jgi:hypothetical protein